MTNFADWRILMEDPTIINFGIPGDTTEGFLTRLDLIIEMKPKRVFLMGGINDIRHYTPIPQITENMTTIVTTLRKITSTSSFSQPFLSHRSIRIPSESTVMSKR